MQKLRMRMCHAPILFPQFMIQMLQKHMNTNSYGLDAFHPKISYEINWFLDTY